MATKIDFSKLSFQKEPLSMQEALKDVVPLELPSEVVCGDKKIKIISAGKVDENHCVKLAMSY